MNLRKTYAQIDSQMKAIFNEVENRQSSWPDYGKEWGPWVDWDGSSDMNTDLEEELVNVYRRSPLSDWFKVDEAHHLDWSWNQGPHDILAYRVQKNG